MTADGTDILRLIFTLCMFYNEHRMGIASKHVDNVQLQLIYLRENEVAQVGGSFTPLGYSRALSELFVSDVFYNSPTSERIGKSHSSLFHPNARNRSRLESTFSSSK
jgi:hypothetical protein